MLRCLPMNHCGPLHCLALPDAPRLAGGRFWRSESFAYDGDNVFSVYIYLRIQNSGGLTRKRPMAYGDVPKPRAQTDGHSQSVPSSAPLVVRPLPPLSKKAWRHSRGIRHRSHRRLLRWTGARLRAGEVDAPALPQTARPARAPSFSAGPARRQLCGKPASARALALCRTADFESFKEMRNRAIVALLLGTGISAADPSSPLRRRCGRLSSSCRASRHPRQPVANAHRAPLSFQLTCIKGFARRSVIVGLHPRCSAAGSA